MVARVSLVLAVAATLAAPRVTHAQPSMTPPTYAPLPMRPVPPPVVPTGSRKDPSTALMLSLLVTGGGYALSALGAKLEDNGTGEPSGGAQGLAAVGSLAAAIGPTTGHIYAGHTWNTGLGVRLVSAGVMVVGVITLLGDIDCERDCGNGDAGAVLIIGGAAGYVGGTIYEIVDAPDEARRYNHDHGWDVQLAALPVRDARNSAVPAFGLAGRF